MKRNVIVYGVTIHRNISNSVAQYVCRYGNIQCNDLAFTSILSYLEAALKGYIIDKNPV